jgi:single stranded DNA-binding protein
VNGGIPSPSFSFPGVSSFPRLPSGPFFAKAFEPRVDPRKGANMSKSNVNKIILVGNLGQDPELRHTAKGNAVMNLSVATSREVKNPEGDVRTETSWHRATVWGKRAETCAKYLTKGSRVYLEGELQMKNWTDKDGNLRKSAEIEVDSIKFLGGGKHSAVPSESVNALA